MSSALLFGKMPSHGDFVARGLEVQEREGLDSWLSAEIADARSAFGGEFEERFDTAPPWRFAWEGERWTAGAMVNSVDSAGRRFPLLVALRAVVAADVGAATEACENAIYDAFEHRWSADELADALASADESGCEAGDCVEGWWTLGGERFPEASLPGRKPPGLVRTMLGGMERAAA